MNVSNRQIKIPYQIFRPYSICKLEVLRQIKLPSNFPAIQQPAWLMEWHQYQLSQSVSCTLLLLRSLGEKCAHPRPNCTHVIVGRLSRSEKYLAAIAAGK